jgi:DNA-directed RNA polymerase beta' subunit
MKIDILNINGYIEKEHLKEVSNPVYFNIGNLPTEDGLFSYTIFGKPGSNDRKTKFAYINLRKPFVHPSVFLLLKTLNRKFEDLILCRKFFRIDAQGNLVEDSENGKTGTQFLYDNFNKISFKETGSSSREKKLTLLNKLKKNEIFITKFLVIPCYYRDFNPSASDSGKVQKVDDLNKLYSKLIMMTQTISENDEYYDFMGLNTESSIQMVLNEIYDKLVDSLAKKTGLIHQALLGKSIDYATRSVISAPRFRTNHYKNQLVPFGYTGIPLSQLCVLFYPFYIKWIQDFIEQHESEIVLISKKTKKEVPNHKLNIRELFNEDLIKKLIELFIKSTESRFQILCIEDDEGNIYELQIMKEQLHREFTLMDLIYMASEDICKDKHVYLTRYPIEQYQNIYPSKISILSTRKTVEIKIDDKYLPNYPVVIPDYPCSDAIFLDTVVPNNTYLNSLGGDYDGDTMSLRGVHTVEANQEADRLIKAKTNMLDQQGRNSRTLGNEAVQALYTLTRM